MDRAAFEKRLETLRQERDAALAQAQALEGAVQDTEFWLAKFEEESSAAEEEAPDEEESGADARHPIDAEKADESSGDGQDDG